MNHYEPNEDELCESRAENDSLLLFAQAETWKAAFAAKGWADASSK
jgi:hypothetical protein